MTEMKNKVGFYALIALVLILSAVFLLPSTTMLVKVFSQQQFWLFIQAQRLFAGILILAGLYYLVHTFIMHSRSVDTGQIQAK